MALPEPDFVRVFDETPVPLLLLTPDFVIVHANRARLEATATTLEATVGRGLFEVFPMNPDDPAADGLVNLRDSLTLTRDTRRPQTMAIQKYDIPMPDGSYEERFWSPRNVPILDERGEVVLLLHRSDDITGYVQAREAARVSAELNDRLRERAERVEHDLFSRTRELEQLVAHLGRATARAELLAGVTAELTSTLDGEEAVGRLAQLVVPQLADWCIVSLVTEGRPGAARALRDVGSWHADEALRPVVAEYAATRLGVLRAGSLLDQALSTGRPQVKASRALEYLTSVLEPGRARDLVTELAPESLLTLPLRARGRTLGVLMLANGAARSPITAEETATATDIAGRAGLALDNARLYRQQRELAEALQRSLLTEPAQPDHLEVAVRYTPAAETARVGGDWYDAFVQPCGTTILTIGDVLGHDTDAAAAMAQIRSLLRGIAVATDAGPAAVLTGVDRAVVALEVGTTATAVVARVEQTPEEARRGVRRLVWSNAGHPPPVVLTPGGTATALQGAASELLLGVVPDAPRTESVVVLEAGSTVLLHTDGLVERRGEGLDDGLARLRDVLEELAARDLDLGALCDEVLDRMLPERPEDDVALLALRMHPED
ncbi:serine phosphatase RsbU (regulator of sigma subunit) [Kineococcus radiotolerans]|uniref:Serine phosphatase RsbU (Regulator of sigma subunit) n=1 Tax=Kineococcus radiotolerans TaxID=131568 RepID=A0A7W4TMA8_KINRA|nr:SpoIIE family protein phosphatase [Kineococcus radiotolerans]MBB2901153.1 serine phosphatase RsbU (regulator of sigma subunit) [Kineococcus radiotolerans]